MCLIELDNDKISFSLEKVAYPLPQFHVEIMQPASYVGRSPDN